MESFLQQESAAAAAKGNDAATAAAASPAAAAAGTPPSAAAAPPATAAAPAVAGQKRPAASAAGQESPSAKKRKPSMSASSGQVRRATLKLLLPFVYYLAAHGEGAKMLLRFDVARREMASGNFLLGFCAADNRKWSIFCRLCIRSTSFFLKPCKSRLPVYY